MLRVWVLGFLVGSGVGALSSTPALDPLYGHVALAALVVTCLTVRRRVKDWGFALAAFCWAAHHQAPAWHALCPARPLSSQVVTHGLGGGERALLVRAGQQAYLAKGFGERGDRGWLTARPTSGGLRSCRFRFTNGKGPRVRQRGYDDGLSSLAEFSAAALRSFASKLPKASEDWLLALVVGDLSQLPSELVLAFRRLGLLHLLAVSGMHLTFLAALLCRCLALPFVFAYSLRLISPRLFMHAKTVCDLMIVVTLFVYVALLGESQAAQRAYMVFALHQLALILWGQRPLLTQLGEAAFLQSLLFPLGFVSEANLLSWTAYLTVLTLRGLRVVDYVMAQLTLFLIVAALWGEASVAGIAVNLVVAPLFSPIFLMSLLLLGQGSHDILAPLVAACQTLTTGFLAALVSLDEMLKPLGPLSYIEHLPGSVRLLCAAGALALSLRTWRELTIQDHEQRVSL